MSVKAQRTQEMNFQQKNEKIKEAASPTTPKAPTSLKKRFRAKKNGALGGGRTHNLHLRRVALYPIELRVHAIQ